MEAPWTLESEVVSMLVQSCRIKLPQSHKFASLDGEIIRVHGELHYRYAAEALQVAIPSPSTKSN